jgi:hypothetical protein
MATKADSSQLIHRSDATGSQDLTADIIFGRQFNIHQFGDDLGQASTPNQEVAFNAALTAMNTAGSGTLIIPAGTYTVGASIDPGTMSGDFEIIFMAGAKLVLASGIPEEVFNLRGAESDSPTSRIVFRNPNIDVSAGLYEGGDSSNTCIAVAYFRLLVIENPDLTGGDDFASKNGDSGISTVSVTHTYVKGGVIRGFADAGFYPGGNNTVGEPAGDGGVCDIEGTHIIGCQQAITAKREMYLLRATDLHIEECEGGILSTEVTNQGAVAFVGPARRMEIRGCTFRKVTANIGRFTSWTTGVFADNTIEDWGYDLTTLTSVGTNGVALFLRGAQGVLVTGNKYRANDWAKDLQIAVKVEDYTGLDLVTYEAGNSYFSGNAYQGCKEGIVENCTHPSSYLDEMFATDVDEPVNAPTFNASSLCIYHVNGDDRPQVARGTAVRELVPYTVLGEYLYTFPSQSMVDDGTVYTFSIADVGFTTVSANGHWVATPVSSGLRARPGIQMNVYATGGTAAEIKAINVGTTTYDPSGETVRLIYMYL